MKRLILFALTIAIVKSNSGQDFDRYEPLKSEGPIPIELRIPTMVKIDREVDLIPAGTSFKQKSSRQDFAVKSNFAIDQLLLSGKILFNDPITDYVTEVGNKIMEHERQSLRDSVKFFVLRSDLSNAFATNQGIVFITLGLLAQLENEAQLAFVLGHEIGHISRHHVISTYIENEKIASSNESRYYSHDDKIKMLSHYSRTTEMEADSMGWEMVKKSDYNKAALLSIFDVLQYSYLPFDEDPYNESYLFSPEINLPENIFMDTIIAISFNEDYDDSKSSHPNIVKRKDHILNLARGYALDEGKEFLISKARFEQIRKLARFETIRINLRDRQYVQALFNIQVLEKEEPESYFLKKQKCKALYGIAKYKTAKKYTRITSRWYRYEGNISRLYRIFEKMDKTEANAVVLSYLYRTNQTLKDDHVNKLIRDLIWDNVEEFNYTFENLKKEADQVFKRLEKEKNQKTDTLEAEPEDTIDLSTLSKYEKIKLQQKKEVVEITESDENIFYHIQGMMPLVVDTTFEKMYLSVEAHVNDYLKDKKAEEEKYKKMSVYQRKVYRKKEAEEDLHEGITEMLVIDPYFFTLDKRKSLKVVDSEKRQIKFNDQLNDIAEKSDIDVQILSTKLFDEESIETYNDIARLYDWVGERVSHDMYFVPSESDYVRYISDKYNTENVAFTGILSYKEAKNGGQWILLSLLAYPLIPVAVLYAVTPEYRTYYFNLVFDIDTGRRKIVHLDEIKSRPNEGFVNSIIYDHFIQIKKKPDEK